jgi:hypothetical protein
MIRESSLLPDPIGRPLSTPTRLSQGFMLKSSCSTVKLPAHVVTNLKRSDVSERVWRARLDMLQHPTNSDPGRSIWRSA